MKLIRTTEVTSVPHGVETPHVTPWLQHQSWRSNTARDTMFTTLKKKIEPPTLWRQYVFQVSEDKKDAHFINTKLDFDVVVPYVPFKLSERLTGFF